jgi:glycosyltransferase involved in cell wall biosynthesis
MKSDFKIIITSPTWSLSGANTVSANLIRGLVERGAEAYILLTRPDYPESEPMAIPTDVPIKELPTKRFSTWMDRCHTLIRYLEEQAPCIYIPNYDWGHSCISPRLSNRIVIVGIMHSVEPIYFEHLSRLGKYWNAVVAVSGVIAEKAIQCEPAIERRVFAIPNGVTISPHYSKHLSEAGAPLTMVFNGRLVQYPKRVFDLPQIVQTLKALHIPVKLTIIGAGDDERRLKKMSGPFLESGMMEFTGHLNHEKAQEIMQASDVFLLTSEFEGMPMSLLEAMGHGCVPVVSDVSSGVPELIEHGINGYRVPIGDVKSFAGHISHLYHDTQNRKRMSLMAYQRVASGGYRIEDMVNRYEEVFRVSIANAEKGGYVRPKGEMTIPLGISPWNYRLPKSVLKIPIFAMFAVRQIQRWSSRFNE